MTTNLFEEVQGADDLNRQLGLLRPAYKEWRSGSRAAEETAFDRLTSILTAIYAFGLDGLKDKEGLREIGKDCQVVFPGDKSTKNWWLPIVTIATGHFHATETVTRTDSKDRKKKVQQPKFVPGTTLRKYAVALRALEAQGVAVEAVEQTVRKTVYESGTVKMGRWSGLIAADRSARKASGKTSARRMHDAGKLQTAARALLKSETVPAEVRAVASADNAEIVAMWGLMSGDVFLPGGRINGDTFDAKAKTLAVAFADAVEDDEEAQVTPGETAELEDAA
jgi:hypothetical protein